MSAEVDRLIELMDAPRPGFLCRAFGDAGGPTKYFRVYHRRGPIPSMETLELLKRLTQGVSPDLLELYQHGDGFDLFDRKEEDKTGVCLYPVSEMEEITKEFREGVAEVVSLSDPDFAPFSTGLVIGGVPETGNYLVLSFVEETAGMIYFIDHEEWDTVPFAQNVRELCVELVDDPPYLLNEQFGSFARYSDGVSNIDWFPEEYHVDVHAAAAGKEVVE